MNFLSPDRLVLLLLPVALVVLWWALGRRRSDYAVRFTNLELLDRVVPRRASWRRWVTVGALLAGVVAVVVAFARPVVTVPVLREQAAVVLAVDVSLSMAAEDVAPSRIEAARAAARRFVEEAPENLQIGLVAFAGTALPVVAPTADRTPTLSAIDRLGLGQGTAVGEAIYSSIDLVASLDEGEGPPPAMVVVLTDGTSTVGRPDAEAAEAAAEARIPVSTVAYGTPLGSIEFQGQRVAVPVDEGSLRRVAEITGGRFFEADSAGELGAILEGIGSQIAFETEDREIGDWFALLGGVLVSVAALGSLVWFGRLEA
ncbi:MAG: VWA domain-containing protein [Acidimicrobiia bacterium]|jgi:Ca-activated chloride channel homolog